jgi:archaeosine-15-forming tRNA-guanine transglycosylase
MDLQPRQRAVGALARATVVVALALSALPTSTSAAPSKEAAALPGGFGVRPVIPKGKELPPSYFVIDAGPGSIAQRSVVIVNGTKKTKTLIVDGVDGLTGQTTGVVYANRDQRHLEASRWVRPAKRVVHVKPGTTKRMRFTVRVPQNVRPGDHVAGLAFEDRHVSKTKSRFSVKQVIRVVVGVQIHVSGGTPGQASVGGMSLQAQPGTKVATTIVQLTNDGDKLCKPTLAVTLAPKDGAPRTVEKKLDTILPKDTIDYPMQFDGRVDSGTYAATAKVKDCGEERSGAATVRLGSSLDGSSPRADRPEPAGDGGGVPSWLLIGGLVIFGVASGIGGLLFVQRLTRRRDAHPA